MTRTKEFRDMVQVDSERLVKQGQGYTYVVNATLHGLPEHAKVRVTIYRDHYAFQCSAKAEVLDRTRPVWNLITSREPQIVDAQLPSKYSHDEELKLGASWTLAAELVCEVYDLLS